MRILVIDEDPAFREVLKMLLRHWGFEVTVAANGLEGLEAAGRFQPDVVLLELDVPDFSGVELIRRFRMEHPTIRLVAMSSERNIRLTMEAMNEGVSDILTKPLRHHRLKSVLDGLETDRLQQRDREPTSA